MRHWMIIDRKYDNRRHLHNDNRVWYVRYDDNWVGNSSNDLLLKRCTNFGVYCDTTTIDGIYHPSPE